MFSKRIRNIKPEDRTVKTYNIIATLPGNDPLLKDEFIVIGGPMILLQILKKI